MRTNSLLLKSCNHPEKDKKVESLIKELFQKSIELGDVEYSYEELKSNWLGNRPAKIETIRKLEEKLEVSFPDDYIELLLVANGFKTSNDAVEPSFLPVEEVDYFKNVFPFAVECYEDVLKELEDSILIAGRDEEQQFLLIPPKDGKKNWKYWKFANWIPGEHEFKDLKDYIKNVIRFLENAIKEKNDDASL